MLCTNRPESFVPTALLTKTRNHTNHYQGPLSHLHSHILTSCFLDTILIPLCTWLYFTFFIILTIIGSARKPSPHKFSNTVRGSSSQSRYTSKTDSGGGARDQFIINDEAAAATSQNTHHHTKLTQKVLSILYYILLLANLLMCILEIVRLSLAHLGVGLLPFTLVSLITAGIVHFSRGLGGRVYGWRYLNVLLWVMLAVTNGVKVAEEAKEGIGARKGSKYPVADEVTDMGVMVGVYVVLAVLESVLWVWEGREVVR